MEGLIALAVLLVIVLIVLVNCIKIVPQAHAMVIERLGGYLTTWSVGLHLKVPFIDRIAKKVILKEQVVDFPPQPVITKDNVTMQIDTVVYFQITDPKLYAYGVENPIMAIENLTATTLRNIIGDLELDETLTSRETINTKMRATLDVATDPWGIKVNRVELKNIIPPKAIQDAMEKQMNELDAEGNTKEGGITVEAAVLMPSYIKVDEQKDLFKGAKLGDIITFNPRKAYPEGEAEISALLKIDREVAKELESDFSYQITEISRYKKAEINQDLFDQVFGKDEVKSEEEFRNKIAESLKPQLETNSNFKFLLDVREYCEKKVGELTWPDALLKRVMLLNNQDKGEEFVEKNYAESIKQLEWHLIKEQLVKAAEVKVEDADIREAAKEMARMQFAQYGMTSIPEEYIDNYANELLKKREAVDNFVERAIDVKLAAALKSTVTLNEKEITLDEFNEMMK